MRDEEVIAGSLLEDACFTLEELARAAAVSPEWLLARIEEGLLAAGGASATQWRFSAVALRRVQRMHAIERAFDAAPELAALVADLLEEIDTLRARVERARPL
ncbi:MAG TPA: chaperone modulator CbpM [Burkholderiales bacterium]|nr:chaperone modulator CbpM [Burkholderiales bacterium]